MKKHHLFLLGTLLALASCTGTVNEGNPQNIQEPQKEEALTDLQKVVKDVCACMEEHSSNQIMAFGCMMAIREKYPAIDAMNDEEAKAELNRRCPELVNKFKKANGLQ